MSPNIVLVIILRRMGLAGYVVSMGERSGTYRVLVGRPEEKRLLGKSRRRWDDSINIDLKEIF
jgi:hypothetical protein